VGKDMGFLDIGNGNKGTELSNIGSKISLLLKLVDIVKSSFVNISNQNRIQVVIEW
jgi:hypothetical protein